jgi:hypothetical protein
LGPFQVITGAGPKLVFPNKYADEIRNCDELDSNEAFRKDFLAHYPGFDDFHASLDNPTLITATLRVKLTQSLGLVSNHLVDETTVTIFEQYREDREWHSIAVKQHNMNLVARLPWLRQTFRFKRHTGNLISRLFSRSSGLTSPAILPSPHHAQVHATRPENP